MMLLNHQHITLKVKSNAIRRSEKPLGMMDMFLGVLGIFLNIFGDTSTKMALKT